MYIFVIKKDGSKGSKYPVSIEEPVYFGSNNECHIRVLQDKVLPKHCYIKFNEKGLPILHNLSKVPLTVSKRNVFASHLLKPGDVFFVGTKSFIWETELSTPEKKVNRESLKKLRHSMPLGALRAATDATTNLKNIPKSEKKGRKSSSFAIDSLLSKNKSDSKLSTSIKQEVLSTVAQKRSTKPSRRGSVVSFQVEDCEDIYASHLSDLSSNSNYLSFNEFEEVDEDVSFRKSASSAEQSLPSIQSSPGKKSFRSKASLDKPDSSALIDLFTSLEGTGTSLAKSNRSSRNATLVKGLEDTPSNKTIIRTPSSAKENVSSGKKKASNRNSSTKQSPEKSENSPLKDVSNTSSGSPQISRSASRNIIDSSVRQVTPSKLTEDVFKTPVGKAPKTPKAKPVLSNLGNTPRYFNGENIVASTPGDPNSRSEHKWKTSENIDSVIIDSSFERTQKSTRSRNKSFASISDLSVASNAETDSIVASSFTSVSRNLSSSDVFIDISDESLRSNASRRSANKSKDKSNVSVISGVHRLFDTPKANVRSSKSKLHNDSVFTLSSDFSEISVSELNSSSKKGPKTPETFSMEDESSLRSSARSTKGKSSRYGDGSFVGISELIRTPLRESARKNIYTPISAENTPKSEAKVSAVVKTPVSKSKSSIKLKTPKRLSKTPKRFSKTPTQTSVSDVLKSGKIPSSTDDLYLEGIAKLLKTPNASMSKTPKSSAKKFRTPVSTKKVASEKKALHTPVSFIKNSRGSSTPKSALKTPKNMKESSYGEFVTPPSAIKTNDSYFERNADMLKTSITSAKTPRKISGVETPKSLKRSPLKKSETPLNHQAVNINENNLKATRSMQTSATRSSQKSPSSKTPGSINKSSRRKSMTPSSVKKAESYLEGLANMLRTPVPFERSPQRNLKNSRANTHEKSRTPSTAININESHLEGIAQMLLTPVTVEKSPKAARIIQKSPFNKSTNLSSSKRMESPSKTAANILHTPVTPQKSSDLKTPKTSKTSTLDKSKNMSLSAAKVNESHLDGVAQMYQTPVTLSKSPPKSSGLKISKSIQKSPYRKSTVLSSETNIESPLQKAARLSYTPTTSVRSTRKSSTPKLLSKAAKMSSGKKKSLTLENNESHLEGVFELLQTPKQAIKSPRKSATPNLDSQAINTSKTIRKSQASVTKTPNSNLENADGIATPKQILEDVKTPRSNRTKSDVFVEEALAAIFKTPKASNSTRKVSSTKSVSKSKKMSDVRIEDSELEGISNMLESPIVTDENVTSSTKSHSKVGRPAKMGSNNSYLESDSETSKTPAGRTKRTRKSASEDSVVLSSLEKVNSKTLAKSKRSIVEVESVKNSANKRTKLSEDILVSQSPVINRKSRSSSKDILPKSKSPQNDLSNVSGLSRLLRTPRTPLNNVSNVEGVKELMKTPYQKSPILGGSRNSLRTSKFTKTPEVDSDHKTENNRSKAGSTNRISKGMKSPILEGVEGLFQTPINLLSTKTTAQVNISQESLFDSLVGRPSLKTYSRASKSVSPKKSVTYSDVVTVETIPIDDCSQAEEIRYSGRRSLINEPLPSALHDSFITNFDNSFSSTKNPNIFTPKYSMEIVKLPKSIKKDLDLQNESLTILEESMRSCSPRVSTRSSRTSTIANPSESLLFDDALLDSSASSGRVNKSLKHTPTDLKKSSQKKKMSIKNTFEKEIEERTSENASPTVLSSKGVKTPISSKKSAPIEESDNQGVVEEQIIKGGSTKKSRISRDSVSKLLADTVELQQSNSTISKQITPKSSTVKKTPASVKTNTLRSNEKIAKSSSPKETKLKRSAAKSQIDTPKQTPTRANVSLLSEEIGKPRQTVNNMSTLESAEKIISSVTRSEEVKTPLPRDSKSKDEIAKQTRKVSAKKRVIEKTKSPTKTETTETSREVSEKAIENMIAVQRVTRGKKESTITAAENIVAIPSQKKNVEKMHTDRPTRSRGKKASETSLIEKETVLIAEKAEIQDQSLTKTRTRGKRKAEIPVVEEKQKVIRKKNDDMKKIEPTEMSAAKTRGRGKKQSDISVTEETQKEIVEKIPQTKLRGRGKKTFEDKEEANPTTAMSKEEKVDLKSTKRRSDNLEADVSSKRPTRRQKAKEPEESLTNEQSERSAGRQKTVEKEVSEKQEVVESTHGTNTRSRRGQKKEMENLTKVDETVKSKEKIADKLDNEVTVARSTRKQQQKSVTNEVPERATRKRKVNAENKIKEDDVQLKSKKRKSEPVEEEVSVSSKRPIRRKKELETSETVDVLQKTTAQSKRGQKTKGDETVKTKTTVAEPVSEPTGARTLRRRQEESGKHEASERPTRKRKGQVHDAKDEEEKKSKIEKPTTRATRSNKK